MTKTVQRSILCGIGGTIISMYIHPPMIVMPAGTYTSSQNGGEFGWDLVALAHQVPKSWLIVPLLGLAIGYGLGFLAFTKFLGKKA